MLETAIRKCQIASSMRWETKELLEQLERLDDTTADDLENETLEIKGRPRGRKELESWVVKLAVCFANRRGGCLLVGVADNVKGRAQAIEGEIVEHERESGSLSLDDLIVLRRLIDVGSIDRWSAAEHLQISESDAASHLSEMRQRELIVARGRGRATSYGLPRPLSERLRGRGITDADHPLETEGVRLKILELLKERGRLTNAEIRDFSGYSRERVLAIEKALEREGLIALRGYGRGAHIVLTEAAKQ
jgi:predicted HTH transcriptional regulator